MKEGLDIICIGSAVADCIIRGFDPTPVSASGYRAESESLHVGGEAVNESMAAAKLGLKTGILCSLGEDEAGRMIVNALERSGVSTDRVLWSSDHPTPVAALFVREDGSRKSVTNAAHRYNFHPELYPDRFADAGALILGSLFRAPFDDPDVLHRVVAAAKEKGQLVFADTKLPNARPLTLTDVRDSLPLIDCITPNEDEARFYSGKEAPEEMADVFLGYGVKRVIIKLGARGCYFKSKEEEIRLSACEIEAKDATGAGDNFLAGFVSEILRGASDAEALRFGNACGAICTTAVGAGTALKNRRQVLDFLAGL